MDNQDLSIGNDVTMRESASDALAVIDQFEILRKLGGGGFGSVYLARDTVAGIEVAVKGLPPVVRNNTEELERIRANFALVSRLHHPYIAAALHLHRVQMADYRVNGVYEELNVGPGDTLMVMEYAPGVTLSQWRKQFPGGKVPLDVAANLVYQVAMALDYSHAHQVLHRDVKPSNIMVETQNDGSVVARVLDFGLAAEIKSSMGRVSTEIHDTSGTRPYMAPEQWAGRKQGPATDQYALACLFCELVSGEVPFASVFETGDPMVMMTAVCNREVELPADCPRQHALKKALSKDPKDRYATCAEFVENLAKSESRFDAEHGIATEQTDKRPVFTPAPVPVNSPAQSQASSRWKSNRLLAVGLILAIGVAVCVGIVLAGRENDRKAEVSHSANSPKKIVQPDSPAAKTQEVTKNNPAIRTRVAQPLAEGKLKTGNQNTMLPNSLISTESFCAKITTARTQLENMDVLCGTQKEKSVALDSSQGYRVSSRYVIPKDAKLIVKAGTKIMFDAGAGMDVHGIINVVGTKDNPVIFCGASDGRGIWDGIKVFAYSGSTVDGAVLTGAKVALDLSNAGVSIFNSIFYKNAKALSATWQNGDGSFLENCLIEDNEEGVTFLHTKLTFRSCCIMRNEKTAIGGTYYGDIKLSKCVIVGNGGGVADGGYDGTAAAHGCIIYGNKEFDVKCTSAKAGDFTGNWWGPDATKILDAQGDGVKLPNIKGNFVNIANFLPECPKSCGSTFSTPVSQLMERGKSVVASPVKNFKSNSGRKDRLSGTQKVKSVTLISGQVYHVENRYIVPKDSELAVEAGVRLIFDAGAGMIIQGKLRVGGRVDSPVVFCGASRGRGTWDGIKIFGYNSSTIDAAVFTGAKVSVELSTADVSIFNSIFYENQKAFHTNGHYGKGSFFENCLIEDNEAGATFHFAAVDFKNCSILHNEKIAVGGTYYGDVKLSGCVVVGNGQGVADGGYDGTATAHGCIIYGNKDFDVKCTSSKAGDFTGNWWGPDTTKVLNAHGDGVKLPNIKGNFVNIADFLTKRPKTCGSSLKRSKN